jgi:hypothetical protein
MRLLFVALTCLHILTPPLPADDAAPKKVALLVGVNEYLKPGFKPLQFAEAAVTAVRAHAAELRSRTIPRASPSGRG